ncbi:MAG: transcriptional regulator, IclR family [Conexibacter sp.]|nr:transcriptional regulator, IclR family [Conexibacter sp.]
MQDQDVRAYATMNTVRALERLTWGPRSVPELADELQLSTPSARRLLRRLAAEGYARQGGWHERRRYTLTLKLAALGRQLVEEHDLPAMASPTLTGLAVATRSPASLWIPGLRAAICVLHDDGRPDEDERGLRPAPMLGALVAVEKHAAGQVLQAWRAPRSAGAAAIRARGHASTEEDGRTTVAAPVHDGDEVVAAISVTTADRGPALEALPGQVVAAARTIAAVLADGIR